MGFTVRIVAYFDWEMTYFVQETNEERAKQKAYQRAKQTWSCVLPDTLEEFENNYFGDIEVVAKIGQIIL